MSSADRTQGLKSYKHNSSVIVIVQVLIIRYLTMTWLHMAQFLVVRINSNDAFYICKSSQ
jgi:hypothetical protein